ncbi:hypothetical protein BC833DRAFT_222367 [Globomyces pollinis-pini]|nr:hypothetical protein BC833DRAFT_222367 [Globomyces pollinis-pini]
MTFYPLFQILNKMTEDTSRFYVIGTGLILGAFSILGSIFVIYNGLKIFRNRGSLSMALKFPVYIAFTDIIICIMVYVNQGYTLMTGKIVTGDLCGFFGSFYTIVAGVNMMLVTSFTCITLLLLHSYTVDLGKYDWRLWTTLIICMTIVSGFMFPYFGSDRYWCYLSSDSTGLIVPIVSTSLVLLLFVVTIILCILVIRQLKIIQKLQKENTDKKKVIKAIETKVTKKMLFYIVTYFIQWGFAIPYLSIPITGYSEVKMVIFIMRI